jgi:hypothetical protein
MSHPEPRKVFISYSWSSEEHQQWVQELAERLVSDGVDVFLDRWELREGHDVNVYMEKMVTDPDVHKVLVVCDNAYAHKANQRKGGVGTESQIISQEVYEKTRQDKFVPIVTEYENGKPCLPVFFKSRLYIDMSDADKQYKNYDTLLRAIYDRPLHKKPMLGLPPSHIFEEEPAHPTTRFQLNRIKDAVLQGRNYVPALVREYREMLAGKLESFRIEPSGPIAEIDEEVLKNIRSMLPYRDEVVELAVFLTNYRNDPVDYDELGELIQAVTGHEYPPRSVSGYFSVASDNFRFLTYELLLYVVAAMIKAARYEEVNRFLSRTYYVESRGYGDGPRTFVDLQPHLQSLENLRKQRLNLDRTSLTADVLKERAGRKDLGFSQLQEADLVLYFRSALAANLRGIWTPLTAIYRDEGEQPKLFRMARSTRYFDALKTMWAVSQSETADTLLRRYFDNGGQNEIRIDRGWPIPILRMCGFSELGKHP